LQNLQNGQRIRVVPHDGPAESGVVALVEEHAPAIPLARPARAIPASDYPASAPWLSPEGDVTGQNTTSINYASFGARVAAAVIDFVILQSASMLVHAVFAGMLLRNLSTTTILAATIGPLVISGSLAFVYSVWMESSTWQATPGKMMLGIKVVDLDGQRIGLGQSSWRNLAKGLSMLSLGFGYLMPLWTARRQAMHDCTTKCLVVRSANTAST